MHVAKAISSIFYTTYTLPHRMKPMGESDKKCDRVGHILTGTSRSLCQPDALFLLLSDGGSVKGLP